MPINLSDELRLAYLRAAQAAQQEEEDKIITYRDFYAGEQAIVLTDRQQKYLLTEPESLGNICRRTVNIPKERLELEPAGISPGDNTSQAYSDKVSDWWKAASLHARQKEIYEAALRDGAAGVIIGWDDEAELPTFTPNLVYDGQTGLLRFHYDSDDNLLFVSKRWTTWDPLRAGETGKRRLTVYRPGQIERYEYDSHTPGGWRFLRPEEIDPALPIPNPQPWTDTGDFSGEPLGIPVIPFENPSGSELQDVLVIQELLNHNLATMDITVDFHGFPLLWFVNADLPKDATTGKSKLPDFGPGFALNLREGGQAGRIDLPDLVKLFQAGILSWVQVLAIVKGWPMWMFDRTAQIPSGIALQIAEGSLVKQVEDKQVVFGGAWLKCFDMARKLHRLKTGEELVGDINLRWESAKTNDEKTAIEVLEKKFTVGEIPTVQRWKELGYSQDEIAEMMAMKEAQQQRAAEMFRPEPVGEQGQNGQGPEGEEE